MNRNFLISIFLWVSLYFSLPIYGENYSFVDTNSGLKNQRVYAIEKDKKGYIWFATRNGLDQFNGKEIRHFPILKEGIDITNSINTLTTDTAGIVWGACSNNIIFVYNKNTDEVNHVITLSDYINIDKFQNINTLYFDKNNHLWICTTKGLFLYQPETQTLHILSYFSNIPVNTITATENGIYYIGYMNRLGAFLLKEDYSIQKMENHVLDSFLHWVYSLYYDNDLQRLYIGGYTDGLFIYKDSVQSIPIGFSDTKITNISPFKESEILVATDGAGVFRLNKKTNEKTSTIQIDDNKSRGLKSNAIYDLFVDNRDWIWMATYPNGVSVLRPNMPTFKQNIHLQNNSNSLIENHVNALLEDSDGDIWYATDNGICMYSPSTLKWTSFLNSEEKGESSLNRIFLSIEEVEKNIFWVGGNRTGIYRIDKKTQKTSFINTQIYAPNTRTNNYVKAIYKDSEGLIWSGGIFNLKCINPKEKSMYTYSELSKISVIKEKDHNTMIIGTEHGIYELNKRNKTVTQIPISKEDVEILSTYISSDSILYVGTDGHGFISYNYRTKELHQYIATNSTLLSNTIFQIVADQQENLFLSTEESIAFYNKSLNTFYNWTEEHGLNRENLSALAGIVKKDGNILFGSSLGTIEFSPEEMKSDLYNSKIVFTDFYVNYQRIKANNEKSPLEKNIDETKHIQLKYDQNSFALDFASINFDYPKDVLYSWRMIGFFPEWTEPNAVQHARYTNLYPGKYIFQLRAHTREDRKLIEQREILISILPPWWKTYWAYLIYLTIMLFIGGLIIRYFINLRENNLSKRKIEFFINTAHDLRTPLTLIKAPLDEMAEDSSLQPNTSKNLQLAIQNTNTLYQMVSNLLTFEKADQNNLSLNLTEVDLYNFLNNIVKDFQVYALRKDISLLLDCNFSMMIVLMDTNKITTIMKNLIDNALKYTSEGGTIIIYGRSETKGWSIEISDNGIGIPKSDQNKLFKRFYRARNAANSTITGSGIGLLLVQKLAQAHKGYIKLKSEEGVGSSFKVTFHTPVGAKTMLQTPKEVIQLPFFSRKKKSLPSVNTFKKNSSVLLIVEDNVELRNYLEELLSSSYIIYTASNGEEALKLTEEINLDLILSDIMMPVMDGEELCQKIKNNINTSHISIILLTALADKRSTIHGLEIGADDYIPKPFDINILRVRIENILQNRKRLQSYFFHSFSEVKKEEHIDFVNELDKEFMEKVQNTLEKKISLSNYTIDTLCQDIGMSRTSFYHKIKALTGQPPLDFIRIIRLNKAASLLKSKQFSVTEVAYKTGFSDMKHFRSIFKKQFGINPGEYKS